MHQGDLLTLGYYVNYAFANPASLTQANRELEKALRTPIGSRTVEQSQAVSDALAQIAAAHASRNAPT